MKLSRSQKKFVRKHRGSLSPSEIANSLNLPVEAINEYLVQNNQVATEPSHGQDYKENNVIHPFVPFIILAGLIAIVFFNALHAGFSSDDIDAIVNSPIIRNFSFSLAEGIKPRLFILVSIYKMFQLQPIAYRAANLFFHLGSSILVFLLGKRLYNQRVGLIAAVLFSVHPVVVESVTWISGGDYPQYTFFLLAAFYTYLQARINYKWYIASLVLLSVALSAEKAVIFPLIPLSYELIIGNLRKHWKKSLGYILVSLILLLILIPQAASRSESIQAGTVQHARWENPLIQFPFSLSTYVELFFFPVTLTFYHAKPLIAMQELVIRWIVTLGFFGSLIFIYKRNKHILFWLVFFLLVLLPVLTPLRVAWTVAERYMYPAVAGLSMAAALGIYEVLKKKKYNGYVYGIFVIIVVLLMARSMVRNLDWQSDDSLWLATLKTSPHTALIHFNVGNMYARKNQFAQAEAAYKKAVELNPVYEEATYELGQLYLKKGMYDEALHYYNKTLAIRPNTWQVYQNIGVVYFEKGQYSLSEQSILKAIELNPNNPSLYFNLGITYSKMGRLDKMQAAFAKAEALEKQRPSPRAQ